MQSVVKPLDSLNGIQKLSTAKVKYGMYYGICVGLAFAVAAWGMDGFRLSLSHALFPWLKFVVGAIACIGIGGLAGRISAMAEKVLIALPLWLAASAAFAWLSMEIPFQIAPALTLWLKPNLNGFLSYTFYPDFQTRLVVVLMWSLIFGFFVGLLQLPMSDSAVFSTSLLGKWIPAIVCSVLMIMSGTVIDSMNNEPLRGALTSVDTVIQYSLDHEGQQIDPQITRQMHLSILSSVQDLIHLPRRLIIGGYDASLGQVHIMVEFGNNLVDCTAVYEQPSFCEKVTSQ